MVGYGLLYSVSHITGIIYTLYTPMISHYPIWNSKNHRPHTQIPIVYHHVHILLWVNLIFRQADSHSHYRILIR